jgi:uncharacterized protein YjbI with pentapeptide repeats
MANPKHVAKLKGSVEAWNAWRSAPATRSEVPDLEGASFVGCNLRKVQLVGAKLKGADFTEADLGGGDLNGADLRKAKLIGAILTDVTMRAANLSEAELTGADLRRADLSGSNLILTDLTGAHAAGADLRATSLSGAVLRDCRLGGANLTDAGLYGCNLGGADLEGCNLSGADLAEVDLTGANLVHANLVRADLVGADVRDAIACGCSFGANDLSRTKGLGEMVHLGPSSIATTTLMRTAEGLGDDVARRAQVEVFLRGCGVEDQWLRQFHSLISEPAEFHSCFITYSVADRAFARRIHDALQARGIRCWAAERPLAPGGADFRSQRASPLAVKVLLCCSSASLGSWWIEKEIDEAIETEKRLRKRYGIKVAAMVPIGLDAAVQSWKNARAGVTRQRIAADFGGWEQSAARFDEQADRVVEALRSATRAPSVKP